MNTISVSNGLAPDQDQCFSILTWVQAVRKGNQQMTKVNTSKAVAKYGETCTIYKVQSETTFSQILA